MYPPKHHQEIGFDNILRTIKEFPLATLISVKDNEPIITHLPLIYSQRNNKHYLIGHMDKFNPHIELIDNQHIIVVFSGPDCYISPTNYTTKQLPTWNYLKVHVSGVVRKIQSDELVINSMIEMTNFLEQNENKFILTKDDDKMNSLVKYVIGFEIEIKAWEGKFKLSQDKLKKDQEMAKNALIASTKKDLEPFLNSIYLHHKNQAKNK